MRKANISKSILSITSPGTNLDPNDPEQGRQLSRACNEYAAELKRQYPDKFSFWASLPLPDLQGSLEELNYALDVLDADGVAVMTNAHGTYLGDSKLDELYRVLDERKVRVFMHPTSPCIKEDGAAPRSAAPLSQYPNPTFEFFFDTARAVINLFYSGVVQRSPGITFMVCHAGGALPPMIDRFTTFSSILPSTIQVGKDEVIKAFNTQFYFDLAGIVFPDQIKGLLSYVDARRITYGSDYPFTPADVAIGLVKTAEVYVPQNFPDANDQDLVWKGNGLRLLGGEEESDKV